MPPFFFPVHRLTIDLSHRSVPRVCVKIEERCVKIVELLQQMESVQASDLFVTVGKRPSLRRYGSIAELGEAEVICEQDFLIFFHVFNEV